MCSSSNKFTDLKVNLTEYGSFETTRKNSKGEDVITRQPSFETLVSDYNNCVVHFGHYYGEIDRDEYNITWWYIPNFECIYFNRLNLSLK